MPEINPPSWLQGASHSAVNDRQMLLALARERGIVAPDHLLVTQTGTPSMGVLVAAGSAFIQGTDAANQGLYHVWSDAVRTVTLAASDPTNPRIDLVIARVADAAYVGGAPNTWALEAVTGTPAGTPAVPALPANSLLLAQVAVGATVTSVTTANITDYRQRAPIPGALIAEAKNIAIGTYAVGLHDSGLQIQFRMPTLAAGQRVEVVGTAYYLDLSANATAAWAAYGSLRDAANVEKARSFGGWVISGVDVAPYSPVRALLTNTDYAAGTLVTMKLGTDTAITTITSALYAASGNPAHISARVG